MTADTETRPNRSLEIWAAEAEAAAALARSLAPTAFVPASLRVRDQETNQLDVDATVASVAAALLTGQELGLSPMASLRSIDIIPPGSGSPALRANAMRALAIAAGHDIWMPERATDTRVVMRGLRYGSALPPNEVVWTMDRAAKMRLRGFASPDSHWKRQPRTMLIARATAEIVRLTCPEVLLGLPYAAEELDDAGVYDAGDEGEPDNAANPPLATPARRNTRRRGNAPTRRREGSPAALPASPSDTHPDDAEDAERAGEPPEPAQEPQPMITASQRARLWAGLRRLGLTERDPALAQIGKWIERDVESSNALTEAEASEVIRAIEAEEIRREAKRAAEDAEALAAAEDARRADAAAEDESQEIPDHE